MTQPSTDARSDTATLIIHPTYTDPVTGALYVHKDLVEQRGDWEVEEHISPIKATERFGDVASWVEYVKRFAPPTGYPAFLSWNARGLAAVLDYHNNGMGEANRCGWLAQCPFVYSPEWLAWQKLAGGQAVTQRVLVESLEDLAEDIREPAAADLMVLLRSLRANVQATASAELRPDGTTAVSWSQDKTLTSGKAGELGLPGILTIAIPVLKGDPQPYQMLVRLRATIDDAAHLAFRLSLVNSERVLEAVYAERVEQAGAELGDGYLLLRAAD